MRFSRNWVFGGGIAASALIAIAVMAAVMRYAASDLLERDANQTAQAWAEFVSRSVPDLEMLLTQGDLSNAAREELKQFRQIEEVFRFKMFDRDGQTVLVSDDLDKPPGSAASKSSIGHGNDTVRQMVLGGRNVTLLETNSTNPNRPAVYSEAYVPIIRNGQLIGVVEVYVNQAARAVRIQQAFQIVAGALFGLLTLIGLAICSYLLKRLEAERRAEERMRYLAHHDVLSGLLNRASFNEALHEAAWRHTGDGPAFAILCIDLDLFKEVNDTLGHPAGDEVLRQVGERLRALGRHGDRVARLGGDEFAILQTGVNSVDDVTTFAERVVETLAQPFDVGPDTIRCNGSVGAAIFGIDATTEEALLHKADLALYRSKAAGRGTFSFYDEELDKALEERRTLVRDLREAIGADQFTLHYQPQFSADGMTLTGYEALLRWTHPTLGLQSPETFIPLAEDTGLIDPLGRWVLRSACAQAALWPNDLTVAGNLSAVQFRQDNLVEDVARALDSSGLPAGRLEIEITESLLMSNTERVTETLGRLAAMGVRIAMDDFGTGYSSMTYLWRFPFDKLKIDRSFTQNLNNDVKVRAIVKSIVSLAHSLEIRVNAEGVEKTTQLDLLRQYECDELQGYLLGYPSPTERLFHLCETNVTQDGTPGIPAECNTPTE